MVQSFDANADAMVVFREGKGAQSWQRRNAKSPVPGRWPYGLDHLIGAGIRAESVEIPELGALQRRLKPFLKPRRSSGSRNSSVALCWDEMTVRSMTSSIAAGKYFSGVIWATDAVAGGQDSAQLRRTASALLRLDGIWVLSRPQIPRVQEWLGPKCPPVKFLTFGVDPDFYRPSPLPATPHVVSVGGDRDRDPRTLFAALEIVRRRRPDVVCTVQTGSDLVAPEGVTTISKLPHIEVASLLTSSTVVAIATRPNLHASGMTVGLEAMASGRPVIACNTPGMEDYFADGVNSLLVPPSDPDAMAASILELLNSEERAQQFGAAGREAVLAKHTTETMCRELAALVGFGAVIPQGRVEHDLGRQ